MVAMCCSLPLPLPSSSTSRSPDILQLLQHCQHYCHQIICKFERFLKLFVDPLPMYQKKLQPIIESWIDYSQWASSETVYSSWQGRGYFLAFSTTQRLQSSSSGERTVSTDGQTYILNKEWPGCPHHLSDFLSILCTLSLLSILYTQKPSRRVDSNQCQIFSQIRSEDIHSGPVGLRMSEVEEARSPLGSSDRSSFFLPSSKPTRHPSWLFIRPRS